MGIFAQVAVLEGKRWNPIKNVVVRDLGWDFGTNRQMTMNYRTVLRPFFEDGIMEIKPEQMEEAMVLVMNANTVIHKNFGYDDVVGFDIEEKLNFFQIATVCKIKNWTIIAG